MQVRNSILAHFQTITRDDGTLTHLAFGGCRPPAPRLFLGAPASQTPLLGAGCRPPDPPRNSIFNTAHWPATTMHVEGDIIHFLRGETRTTSPAYEMLGLPKEAVDCVLPVRKVVHLTGVLCCLLLRHLGLCTVPRKLQSTIDEASCGSNRE